MVKKKNTHWLRNMKNISWSWAPTVASIAFGSLATFSGLNNIAYKLTGIKRKKLTANHLDQVVNKPYKVKLDLEATARSLTWLQLKNLLG